MRVEITKNHVSLSSRLLREIGRLTGKFTAKSYSKITSIEKILLKRDISVEKKKKILVNELHKGIAEAFSVRKEMLDATSIKSMGKRLAALRKITIKLRSINHYLESTFFQDIKISNLRIGGKAPELSKQSGFGRDELELLESIAYKMIEKAASLDKSLMGKYGSKARAVSIKEGTELKGLGIILRREMILLEHLEAKLPPPGLVTRALAREPSFTHWAARIFALLLQFEWLYGNESLIFRKLKKNKVIRAKINKKIMHLVNERAKLMMIMQEKAESIRKFRLDGGMKKELRNFTTTVNL